MSPEYWAELKQAFSLVVAAGPDRAAEELQRICAGNPELLRELEPLVKEHFRLEAEADRDGKSGGSSSPDRTDEPLPELDPARFRFIRRLGSGTFGDVYEVHDQQRGSAVALKILRDPVASALLYFKREFRSLAKVRHPNLVELYELIRDGARWMFTMELVEGKNFLEHIRQDQNPASGASAASCEARIRAALPQLAGALNTLHQAGLLHRDLKPANVIVRVTGRVTLVDFGLVRDFGAEATAPMTLAGTPDYMSPEQANLQPLTAASDWYAVGVMLYQALTGRLPFSGGLLGLVQRKASDVPIPPDQFDAACPADLSSLAVGLLSHDPAERLRYAALAGSTRPAHPIPPRHASATGPNRIFVGRERELTVMQQAYSRVASGAAAAVHISGPSGVGKTVLLRELLGRVRSSDPSVLMFAGRCYEGESVPYQGLDDLVDSIAQHLRRLGPEEVEQLLPRNFWLMVRMFPVLRQVCMHEGRSTPPGDSGELRSRAFSALCEMLGRIAERRRVVLVIDDLQWADLDSGVFFRQLIESVDAPPLLLMMAYRSEDLDAVPWLKDLRGANSLPEVGASTDVLELAPLAREETARLARALAGQAAELTDDAVEAVVEQSGGDPFLVDEIIRWMSSAHVSGTPFRIETFLKSRCEQLVPVARNVLELVAVAGQPVEVAVIKQHFDAAEFSHAREILVSARLLRSRTVEGRDEVEIYHDRIRAALVAGLRQDEVRRRHLEVASILASSGSADPERLAFHFYQAGQFAEAAEHAKAAAQRALDTFAFYKAARFYRIAVEHRDRGDPEYASLWRRLGDALSSAGLGSEAADAYLNAAGEQTGWERRRLLAQAAAQQLRSGYSAEGAKLMREVLREIGIRSPERGVKQLLWVGCLRLLIKLHGLGFRERTVDQLSAEELFRMDLCGSAALGYSMRYPLLSVEFSSRFVLLALKAGEPYRVALALAGEATQICHSRSPDYTKAWELVRRAEAIAGRIDNVHARAFVMLMSSVVLYFEGRWRQSCELAEEAAELLRSHCHGVHWELGTAALFSFVARAASGRWRESRRILPLLIRDAEARGDLYAQLSVRIMGCVYVLDLAAGRAREALINLERDLVAWGSDHEFDLQRAAAMNGKIDIALYEDDLDAGWRVLESEWPLLEKSHLLRLPSTFVFSHSARGRLSLASARRSPPNQRSRYLKMARDSARSIIRRGPPWGKSLADLLLAGVSSFEAGRAELHDSLTLAERSLEKADLTPFRMGALYRQAQLDADPRSTPQWKQFEAWVSAEEVKEPDRIAAVLAPGNWREVS